MFCLSNNLNDLSIKNLKNVTLVETVNKLEFHVNKYPVRNYINTTYVYEVFSCVFFSRTKQIADSL